MDADMHAEDSKRQLMGLFLGEIQERTRDLERNLLAIEPTTNAAARLELLKALLRTTHSLKGAAGLMEVRPIETACHWMEELFSSALRDGRRLDRRQIGMLLETIDALAEYGRVLDRGEKDSCDAPEERLHRLAESIRTNVDVAFKSRKDGSTGHPPALRAGDDAGPSPPGYNVADATTQRRVVRSTDLDGSVQVAAEKLDSLLFRSGELLISRSLGRTRVDQTASLQELTKSLRRQASNAFGNRPPVLPRTQLPNLRQKDEILVDLENGLRKLKQDLADDSRILERAAASLADGLHRARMQPFAQACRGLARIVRDMSADQGKLAELAVEGGGIEIDRSILGGLQDSLRHLVRNAVDHGLETPEDRAARNKPAAGRIVIAAVLRGDQLQVRVEDDGGGIDVVSLREHAPDKDGPGAQDEEELLRRVFLPGVSTSPTVTRLSGRGMGLDIVKNAVEKLRGTVQVAHTPGKGTAFTLTLPLTVTTIRALLIVAGDQIFALDPISSKKLLRVSREELRSVSGRAFIPYDGRTIPVLDLAGWLGMSTRKRMPSAGSIVVIVIGTAGREAALLVDEVAGEQELLIRVLGPRLEKLRIFSGGAILPDGQIALVLNAAALLENATGRNLGRDLPPFEQAERPQARKRILIVDDSPTVRALEKIMLEAAGYQVSTASDGSEAWDVLQTEGADAVIADVDMPRMDGFMFAQAIRQSQHFSNLPIILVTAREEPQDKTRGLEVGANAYLLKSTFDQRQLLELIRQVL
ncbi:MAG: response regulator [Mesorhizobium sp.]|nr:MAG: response regulator [Mesorhizobium sp.]